MPLICQRTPSPQHLNIKKSHIHTHSLTQEPHSERLNQAVLEGRLMPNQVYCRWLKCVSALMSLSVRERVVAINAGCLVCVCVCVWKRERITQQQRPMEWQICCRPADSSVSCMCRGARSRMRGRGETHCNALLFHGWASIEPHSLRLIHVCEHRHCRHTAHCPRALCVCVCVCMCAFHMCVYGTVWMFAEGPTCFFGLKIFCCSLADLGWRAVMGALSWMDEHEASIVGQTRTHAHARTHTHTHTHTDQRTYLDQMEQGELVDGASSCPLLPSALFLGGGLW